jgi:hypothetical protein
MSNIAQNLDYSDLSALKTKSQLNSIIVNKDKTPDYLAINIYYDSLRSWYSPKKQYQEDGNIIHIRKLKSDGIYYSAEQLSKKHGCSKETIRKKLVKLELLGLIHRNFEHKSTPTTNSYNHRCIFVWKNTPYFYNEFGIDRTQIKKLKSQTNAEYVKSKYGVEFGVKTREDTLLESGGGIHTLEGTKELREVLITNVIRSKGVHAPESNLSHNPNVAIQNEITKLVEIEKVVGSEGVILDDTPKPLATVTQLAKNKPMQNRRKKPLNASIKAKVIKLNAYSKPKSLIQMHDLLDQSICDELRSKSGRAFSNNFISQRIIALSKNPNITASFRYKAGFISYMTLILKNELHQATTTSGENFRLRVNMTENDIHSYNQEKFLNGLENEAIRYVCKENQLKAKLANALEKTKAYQLLSNLRMFSTEGNAFKIHLNRAVSFTEREHGLILAQVQATYDTVSSDNQYQGIEHLEFIVAKATASNSNTNTQQGKEPEPLQMPEGVWGKIVNCFIDYYGKDAYINWISKLQVKENDKLVELTTNSEMVKDRIMAEYWIFLEEVSEAYDGGVVLK